MTCRTSGYDTDTDETTAPDQAAGWGRQDWERLADRTLAAVRPYATPGHALIHLPGPTSRSGRWSDGLEGFARTFLLAGFRLAGAGDRDPGGLAEWYAAGLAAGTDPDSPESERWPALDDVGQAKVECASIAIALHESRPWIWDRLDERVRGNVVDWMSAMLGTQTPDNNWTWFRAVTQAFLRSVGSPWRQEDIDHTLARTEAWYVGGGWYSDGEPGPGQPRNFDYYSGWAMHFYPLWYCRISGERTEPGLLDRYRGRLREYLEDARRLIGGGGRPLIQGRSLTYRFAMLAPFWAGAVFDATPLTPGGTRRLAGAVANHFVESGGFDAAGLLPIGWHRPFEPMRETYSGAGSPYWVGKGFAGLVLPPDHPVWTAPEEPLPIETGDVSFALPRLGWIVSGTREDGIVRVAQHGGDHAATDHLVIDVPGYARHGYATHAAPEYGSSYPLDSHVALITADGRVSHRSPALSLGIDAGRAISRHRAHWWQGTGPIRNDPHRWRGEDGFEVGPWLTTASLLHGPWEVRLARVDLAVEGSGAVGGGRASGALDPAVAAADSAVVARDSAAAQPPDLGGEWPEQAGPWKLRFGGWALALDESIRPQVAGGAAWAVRADRLSTTIVALRGDFWAGCTVSQGTNPLGAFSAIPQVETVEAVEPGRIYGALVVLSGTMAGPDVARGVVLEVHGDGDVGGSAGVGSSSSGHGGFGATTSATATGTGGLHAGAGSGFGSGGVVPGAGSTRTRVAVTWPDGHRDEMEFPPDPA